MKCGGTEIIKNLGKGKCSGTEIIKNLGATALHTEKTDD